MIKIKSTFSKIWDELKDLDTGINLCVSGLLIYFIFSVLSNIDANKIEKTFEDISQYLYGGGWGLSFTIGMILILCSFYMVKIHNEWRKFINLFWITLIIFVFYLCSKLYGAKLSSNLEFLPYEIYIILFCILSYIVFYCISFINKYFSNLHESKIIKATDIKEVSSSEQDNQVDNIKISKSDNYDKIVGLAFESLCISLIFCIMFTIIISFISDVSLKSLVLKCGFTVIELFITSVLLAVIMGCVQNKIENDGDNVLSKKIIKLIAGCFMVYIIVICFDNVIQNTILSPTYSVQLIKKDKKDKISNKNLLKNIKNGKVKLEIIQNK